MTYLWGGKDCNAKERDCSGSVRCWILKGGGPDIGLGTWHQLQYCKAHGKRIGLTSLRAGDIIFLDGLDGTPSHVGLITEHKTVLECTLREWMNGVVEVAFAGSIWQGPEVHVWRLT